jgi:hypothetical protein
MALTSIANPMIIAAAQYRVTEFDAAKKAKVFLLLFLQKKKILPSLREPKNCHLVKTSYRALRIMALKSALPMCMAGQARSCARILRVGEAG